MQLEIKICGLTNVDDVVAALEFGADYVGFVFYAKSPRCMSLQMFERIAERLGRERRAVAVFVNPSRKEVEKIIGVPCLRAVQLHGDELPSTFADLGVEIWRAVRQQGAEWTPSPDSWPAARYVVDASVPNRYGGTGIRADWSAAAALAQRWPVMLAGGLTADNVTEAIRIVRPLGVDVSSGIEVTPGKKDLAKLERFVANVRAAAATIPDV